MSGAAIGAAAGLLGGLGLLLVAGHVRDRRVRLEDRVAPYLRAPRSTSGLLAPPPSPWGAAHRLLAPWLADGVRLVARYGAPAEYIRSRLARAGRQDTVEQFRARQVLGMAVGLAAGLVVAAALALGPGAGAVSLLGLVAVAGVTGALVPDVLLSRQVATREARILAELPTVAELLALAVGAGEGAVGALERVARTTRGELARELELTLADARSGTPLITALHRLADRVRLAPLTRFADGVAVAVERGTPLADVLRALAQDVRESGRRALMETGGRKEVAMMVPVVFLILPVTVVFAVFPSFSLLRVGL